MTLCPPRPLNLPIDAILSTGSHNPQGPVPPLRVVQYVPYSELYPRVSSAATNGGIHSVREQWPRAYPW